LYSNATAPGLISQPGFVQLGQGVRIKPDTGDYLKLNYVGSFEEFFAPSSSTNSFERWTVDLNHTLYLYGNAKAATSSTDQHGPDSCAHVNDKCPEIPHTRNLNDFITLEAAAFGVDQLGDQRCTFLFPADAGRAGHQ
jgi:hypothetical protein